MERHDHSAKAISRRTFLERTGAAAAAVAGGSLLRTQMAGARPRPSAETPLRNIVISCQENRSFDHYFGYAPQVQAQGFGPPAGYGQPDGNGGFVVPYEFTSLST